MQETRFPSTIGRAVLKDYLIEVASPNHQIRDSNCSDRSTLELTSHTNHPPTTYQTWCEWISHLSRYQPCGSLSTQNRLVVPHEGCNVDSALSRVETRISLAATKTLQPLLRIPHVSNDLCLDVNCPLVVLNICKAKLRQAHSQHALVEHELGNLSSRSILTFDAEISPLNLLSDLNRRIL